MSTQHARFLKRLNESQAGLFAFALWLHNRGDTVEIPGMKRAPDAADHALYADEGDLFYVRGSVRRRIEVKTLRVDFSGNHDWPFREIFISSQATVERAAGGVSWWVTVNRKLTKAVVIPASTSDKWFLVERRASNTGNLESFYAAPNSCGIFRSIEVPDG